MESDGAELTLSDGIVFSCNLQLINCAIPLIALLFLSLLLLSFIITIIIINVTRYIYVMLLSLRTYGE